MDKTTREILYELSFIWGGAIIIAGVFFGLAELVNKVFYKDSYNLIPPISQPTTSQPADQRKDSLNLDYLIH